MSTLKPVLIRCNAQDNGTVPVTGYPWESPDIITVGTKKLSPQEIKNLVDTYYTDPYYSEKAVTSGVENYIYIRVRNLDTTAAQTGTVSLYWSGMTTLLFPKDWEKNELTCGGSNTAPFTVDEGGVAVVGPFTWDPSLFFPDSFGHPCFSTFVVVTPDQKNAPPASGTPARLDWLREHPGVASRNSWIKTGSDDWKGDITYGNPLSSEQDLTIAFSCYNFPKGATLTVESQKDGEPNPQVTKTFKKTNGHKLDGYSITFLKMPATPVGKDPIEYTMAVTVSLVAGTKINKYMDLQVHTYSSPAGSGDGAKQVTAQSGATIQFR